jgi:hypothetical protein
VADDLGRRRFAEELQDPRVRDKLLAYTKAEVGGQGPQAWQAFIETTLNRAVARRKSLADVLSGEYFPGVTHQRAARGVDQNTRAAYDPVVQSVLGGSRDLTRAGGRGSEHRAREQLGVCPIRRHSPRRSQGFSPRWSRPRQSQGSRIRTSSRTGY